MKVKDEIHVKIVLSIRDSSTCAAIWYQCMNVYA
jgi:hypothetical protein